MVAGDAPEAPILVPHQDPKGRTQDTGIFGVLGRARDFVSTLLKQVNKSWGLVGWENEPALGGRDVKTKGETPGGGPNSGGAHTSAQAYHL